MNTSEGQLRLSGLKKVREVHFRSFGHMLNMELLGNKKEEDRRFMDAMKEDMQKVDVTEEDARDGVRWRKIIYCGDP